MISACFRGGCSRDLELAGHKLSTAGIIAQRLQYALIKEIYLKTIIVGSLYNMI